MQVYSIKLIFRVLELTLNVLEKQSNISIMKLIIEKIVRETSSNHTDISKNVSFLSSFRQTISFTDCSF